MTSPALFPYQVVGAAFLRSRRRAALFDSPGLGKTVQALAAIPESVGVVVVAPKIAKSVWVDSTLRWRPDLRPLALSGRGSFRWPSAGELLVLNYELLPPSPPAAVPEGTVLVGDEAHYLKSWRSLRSTRFRSLSRAVLRASGSVWVLTGTPMTKDPPDLWCVLAAAELERDVFGNWPSFERAFGATRKLIRARGGREVRVVVWGRPEPWVRSAVRTVSLRRTREEVLPDLPRKLRSVLRVDCLTPAATRLADEALARLRKIDVDPEIALARVLDAADSERIADIATVRRALSVLKIAAASELLDQFEAAGRQVVLFSVHRAPVEALAASRPGWSLLVGGMPDHVREAVVRDFQRGRFRGVAATIGAAGTAITLTASSDVVFVDLDWTPAANVQAEDRVCRIGQSRGVTVTVLQADHALDALVVRVLARKVELFERTIGG